MTLHILGIGSHPERMVYFKRTADMFGVDVRCTIFPPLVDGNQRTFEWARIMHYVNYAKSVPENDIIVCTDTYDVLINQPANVLVDRFLSKQCDILLSGEMNCYPTEYLPKWSGVQTPSKHRYPNGGCYMGTAKGLLYLFGGWKSLAETETMCKSTCDQAYLHEFYLAHHGQQSVVQVDWDCSIFQSMHLISWNDFAFRNGQIYNKVMGQYPCIVHFNGGVWQTNTKQDIQPVFVQKMAAAQAEDTLNGHDQIVTATCFPHSQV
jgi:hypothetical protein